MEVYITRKNNCTSVFKSGGETTKEAFTSAMARTIVKIEGGRIKERIHKTKEASK